MHVTGVPVQTLRGADRQDLGLPPHSREPTHGSAGAGFATTVPDAKTGDRLRPSAAWLHAASAGGRPHPAARPRHLPRGTQGTFGSSGRLSRMLDELQFTFGEGPCLRRLVDPPQPGRLILVEDREDVCPWLSHSSTSAAAWTRASSSVPLRRVAGTCRSQTAVALPTSTTSVVISGQASLSNLTRSRATSAARSLPGSVIRSRYGLSRDAHWTLGALSEHA